MSSNLWKPVVGKSCPPHISREILLVANGKRVAETLDAITAFVIPVVWQCTILWCAYCTFHTFRAPDMAALWDWKTCVWCSISYVNCKSSSQIDEPNKLRGQSSIAASCRERGHLTDCLSSNVIALMSTASSFEQGPPKRTILDVCKCASFVSKVQAISGWWSKLMTYVLLFFSG